jgi:hypothetical protein
MVLVSERTALNHKLLHSAREVVYRRCTRVQIWSRMQSSFPGHARQDCRLVIVAGSKALMYWWRWRASSAAWWFAQCTSWRGAVSPHPGGPSDLQRCWCWFCTTLLFWRALCFRIEASYHYLQKVWAKQIVNIFQGITANKQGITNCGRYSAKARILLSVFFLPDPMWNKSSFWESREDRKTEVEAYCF